MDNPFKSPAVLSLCPGLLGIERGLKRAGVQPRVVAYVEIEAFIIANLVAGMEAGILDPAPIWTDARSFNAMPFRGKIHGIIGGYPCPGESVAGLREGHLYKGFIWPAIRRAIAAAGPIWCFFENVDDHLTGTYPIIQRSLRQMGFAVEAGIYTAEEVGAPHERQRLFILAVANCYRERLQAWCKGISPPPAYSKFERCSKKVGNSDRKRSQGIRGISVQDGADERWYKIQSGITGASAALWPAGQGIYQHSWEAPRTTKSGVGCTINGYNFREDLLRALGNSVVEQCAEIAFLDLLQKHLKA